MCIKLIIRRLIEKMRQSGILKILPTFFYLQLLYWGRYGQWLNLCRPTLFIEKLNWLKIHDRKQEYSKLVDKYLAKGIAERKIGEQYIVPCYGVWESFDDIVFEELPNKFVLKATHDSSGVYRCESKKEIDYYDLKKTFDNKLSVNWYDFNREWPYKNIKPRIIAEKYLYDGRENELQDYKFMCFNGEPKIMYITNKGEKTYENYYDMDFAPLNISHGYDRYLPEYSKPSSFDEMKELSRKLSEGVPFIRIDFYEIDNHPYFGEFTFYDWGGVVPFVSNYWEKVLGGWLSLPKI